MRRRRKQRSDTEGPGQDSFLDVVANLVGILIILVMVVGARAKDAWVESGDKSASSSVTELAKKVAASMQTTEALRTDINEIDRKAKTQQAVVQAKRSERDQIQLLITAAEAELERRRGELDAADRKSFDMQRNLNAAKSQLDELKNQRDVAERSTAPTTVIDHIPTPMAKTVFGQEIHFRLLGGRLAYVPLEGLIEKMKDEIRVKAEKLRSISQTTETVGPIAGFHLRYKLALVERVEQTQIGVARLKLPQFIGFYLIPTSDQLGEPFRQALSSGSQFLRMIEGLNPDTTTITVWVYPDSFNEFLTLKREMFNRGFLTASWPLPDGQPISGGPNGRRSSAQ